MGDAGEMIHDEMIHDGDKMTHDEMTHDDAEVEMIYNDGDGVDAALIHSSNNIESNCMDSHIYSKSHHDLVSYQKARCMNSMSSTPIKQSKSFSYLLLFIMY
jgi:hypothetical protein